MFKVKGYIHSIQSLGTVDGPGVRAVVFTAGCPLRCLYCHNPDTWSIGDGTPTEASEIAERIGRLYPYIKNGGVTFSGGEPCVQAKFLCELARLLRERGLHIALDTSGAVLNEDVVELLRLCDLVLLDIKACSEEDYRSLTGGSLKKTLEFLDTVRGMGIPVWIRQVVVPGVNDTPEDIKRLADLLADYGNVERIELLPFRKLCLEKYDGLGIEFPLRDTPEMSEKRIAELTEYLG